jgi:chromate transporter
MMLYLQLFITFFKIGLFGFGGGAAMLSLIQFEVVEHYGWITASEFTNMVAVSQITPGPIGINCATYAGYLATGNILGSAVATISLVLPSFIIMMLLIAFMAKKKDNRYIDSVMRILRPVVIGLIAAAALLLITEETFGAGYSDWIAWLIFAGAFIVTKWFRLSPILMILFAAIIGLVVY